MDTQKPASVPLSVLIVEDNPRDAELILDQLQQAGFQTNWERVETEANYRARLSPAFDIILCDHSMPQFGSQRALQILLERGLDTPFVIVSGTIGEDAAVAAMKNGAADYVLKDRLIRLGEAVRQALRQKQLRAERIEAENVVQALVRHSSAAAELGAHALGGSDVSELMNRAVVLVAKALKVEICSIWEILPDGKNLLLRAGVGWKKGLVGKAKVDIGAGTLAGFKLLSQEPFHVDNQRTETPFNRSLSFDDSGVVSSISAIIYVQEQPFGVLATHTVKERSFTSHDNNFIETVANNILAPAIQRKRVEEELTALNNGLSVLFTSDNLLGLGQQITQAVVREFGTIDCGLMIVDTKKKLMIRLARAGDYGFQQDAPIAMDGPGLVQKAVRTGELIYVPDVSLSADYMPSDPRTRSELVIPLLTTSHGVIGVFDLQSPEENAFSGREQRILKAFAERAARALQIVQLYEEVNRYAEELEWRVAERTAELQQTKEHVEAILSNSADVIIVIGLDGAITNTNPALNTLFGYAADEILDKPLSTLFETYEVERVKESIDITVTQSRSVRSDVVARRADGSTFQSDILFSSIVSSGGDIAGVVCSLRDITVRRDLEENLRTALAKEKELNDLKSRFISMVSHEFRTPLSVILSSAEMLEMYADRMSEARKQERIKNIQNQVHRLTGFLESVLTLGKAEYMGLQFQPTAINLVVCCQDFVEEAQIEAGTSHQIVSTILHSCAEAVGDAILLQHIVSNLLSNAVKYSPAGSNVYFDLSCVDDQAVICVRDEGIGIPEKEQPRLFETFFRAQNVGVISGTGLGLAIVKRAVDAHMGTIAFESQEGVGTTFTVVLPMSPVVEVQGVATNVLESV